MINITQFAQPQIYAISILITILLIALLATKELLDASGGKLQAKLSKTLNIAIVPLTMSFFVTVVMKIVEILN